MRGSAFVTLCLLGTVLTASAPAEACVWGLPCPLPPECWPIGCPGVCDLHQLGIQVGTQLNLPHVAFPEPPLPGAQFHVGVATVDGTAVYIVCPL